MKRDFGPYSVWLAAISAGRPQNVEPTTQKLGPATWYVPADQSLAYMEHGAQSIALGSDSNVPQARNHALRNAWERGLPCLMVDDDLKKMRRVITGPTGMKTGLPWTTRREEIEGILSLFIEAVTVSPYRLGAAPPTSNHFFASGGIRSNVLCTAPIWLVKPCNLWLDTNLTSKEDYDYTLQHIDRFGGVCRCEFFVCDFDYKSKVGGMSAYRSPELEEGNIAYLKNKWGDKIKRNTKRENEILLRLPKTDRVVLI